MNIIVIGGGLSALRKPLGKTINNFDIVVRINWPSIIGYEEFVGTKYDVLACFRKPPTEDVKLASRLGVKTFLLAPVRFWDWGQIDNIRSEIISEFELAGTSIDFEYIDKETNIEIEKDAKLYGVDGRWASTGLMVVGYYLETFDIVYTLGIDAFLEPEAFINGDV